MVVCCHITSNSCLFLALAHTQEPTPKQLLLSRNAKTGIVVFCKDYVKIIAQFSLFHKYVSFRRFAIDIHRHYVKFHPLRSLGIKVKTGLYWKTAILLHYMESNIVLGWHFVSFIITPKKRKKLSSVKIFLWNIICADPQICEDQSLLRLRTVSQLVICYIRVNRRTRRSSINFQRKQYTQVRRYFHHYRWCLILDMEHG